MLLGHTGSGRKKKTITYIWEMYFTRKLLEHTKGYQKTALCTRLGMFAVREWYIGCFLNFQFSQKMSAKVRKYNCWVRGGGSGHCKPSNKWSFLASTRGAGSKSLFGRLGGWESHLLQTNHIKNNRYIISSRLTILQPHKICFWWDEDLATISIETSGPHQILSKNTASTDLKSLKTPGSS